jgi:hypothetical protein
MSNKIESNPPVVVESYNGYLLWVSVGGFFHKHIQLQMWDIQAQRSCYEEYKM